MGYMGIWNEYKYENEYEYKHEKEYRKRNMNMKYVCVFILFEYNVGIWSDMEKWKRETYTKTMNNTKITNH